MKKRQFKKEGAHDVSEGKEMYALIARLFPLNRSLTGDGVRETLRILQEYIPLTIHEVPTGTRVFDWTIPKEWNIRGGYIEKDGPSSTSGQAKRIVDFADSNLHVVGYSTPINKKMPLEELKKYVHSIPEMPDAIPYITSYYRESWGFCMTHRARKKLKKGEYHVVIDSELKNGSLTYGEYIIPGETEKEILFSTYICHPSMANNELSGPVIQAFIAKMLKSAPKRRYTYRFVFAPEAIGAATYIAKNIDALKRNVVAGFNLTCVGDERQYSYLPTRYGNTLTDRVIQSVLDFAHPKYKKWSFLDRGSDERQYCSPLVDLPVASLMRSKYGEYPEYHTSKDDMKLVTPQGLYGSYDALIKCVELLERNRVYKATVPCEPQLGKRGLYETDAKTVNTPRTRAIVDLLAYADGTNDLIAISNIIGVPPWDLYPIVDRLLDEKLVEEIKN